MATTMQGDDMVEITVRGAEAPDEFLRLARDDEGLTVAEAARRIGVSDGVLGRAERGPGSPRPRSAFRIAAFYGVRVTDVWGDA